MSERLPAPIASRIGATTPTPAEVAVLEAGTHVVRIHPLTGDHPCAWDEFRRFGPTGSRFDHHPAPPRVHSRRAIMYLTYGPAAFTTGVAEYFQNGTESVGPIDRATRSPAMTAFALAMPIRLLDLGTGWVTRAGGNQAIASGRRSTARDWARAIYRQHKELDGLLYPSSVWGPGSCIALWERARRAIPPTCDLHRGLADPVLDRPIAHAADQLGTVLVR